MMLWCNEELKSFPHFRSKNWNRIQLSMIFPSTNCFPVIVCRSLQNQILINHFRNEKVWNWKFSRSRRMTSEKEKQESVLKIKLYDLNWKWFFRKIYSSYWWENVCSDRVIGLWSHVCNEKWRFKWI